MKNLDLTLVNLANEKAELNLREQRAMEYSKKHNKARKSNHAKETAGMVLSAVCMCLTMYGLYIVGTIL